MPVYNGDQYLKEAIDSILNQTFTDFEFIVINDGSTDRTEDIILSYADERIRYIKNEANLKIVKTLNKGVGLSRGKYIARMDADDVSLPARFLKQVNYLEKHLDIDICGCYTKVIGRVPYSQKFPISSESIKIAFLFYSSLPHPALMIRANFFKNKKYDEEFQKAEDYRLWTLHFKESEYHNISETLLYYRQHENQISERSKLKQEELSGRVREDLLKALGLSFTQEEIALHNDICSGRYVDVVVAERWLRKLVSNNVYFENSLFVKQINDILWRVLNNAAPNGLSTYFKYAKLKKEYVFNVSLLSRIIFFLKVILRRKRLSMANWGAE